MAVNGEPPKTMQDRVEGMIDRWSGKRMVGRPVDNLDCGSVIVKDPSGAAVLSAHGTVSQPARDVPVLEHCDVLVVGAGPAGLSAALAARRAGVDVVLCERFGCFGGVITTVGMETIGWYRYEGTVEGEGIGLEMERLAERMGGTIKWPYNDSECLDADFFKVVADHLIRESGVRPLLHCLAVDVIMDTSHSTPAIAGIITESKSGRQAVLASRVVDCTGDADIAWLAGAPCTKLQRKDMMSLTTVFNCSGVDAKTFLAHAESKPATYADWSRVWAQETTGKEDTLRSPYLDVEFEDARKQGAIPDDSKTSQIGGSWSAINRDTGEATNLNLAHIGDCDCTDVRDLTRAEMEGRTQGMHALAALKATVPGFKDAKLRNFGSTIGCRDSRKIVGRYNLTKEDVTSQAAFDDSIGIFPEFIDGYNILVLPTTGRYFQVPLGCMTPQGVDNLLVAGRCVAGDRTSHAAMRNMMACTVTGQGAGVAAAVSIQTATTTGAVEIEAVQTELTRQGVRLS